MIQSSTKNSAQFPILNLEPLKFPGMHPHLIVSAVKNTAPFIFSFDLEKPELEFAKILSEASFRSDLSVSEYFEICIAAHFSTVATFIPTDLDQTIRLKLWKLASIDDLEAMARSVDRFLNWSDQAVSRRQVISSEGHYLTGHYGEWFTLALPAYWMAKTFKLSFENDIRDKIINLVRQHELNIADLVRSESSRDLFTAVALVAHNLGDLDRAFDLWEISDDDFLRREIYKLGHAPRNSYRSLYLAGELNKKFTSAESHRHFALRKPASLRKSADFLIGMGPFFDEWGRTLGRHPDLTSDELSEIIEALVDGWERVNRNQRVYGYARALHGLLGTSVGHRAADSLPSSRKKLIRSGSLAQMISVPTDIFLASSTSRLLKFIRQSL